MFRPSENAIIISGLALWTSTLLKNPALFSDFLKWESDGMTASDFVRNGIYSGKSLAVRIAYKMSFELLCKSFPSSTSLQPLSFILSVFIQNFPEQGADEVKSKQTKDCNEFFSIFIELIKYSRKENLKYKENFDLKKLLIESILRMKTH